jgi:hypothetical protein
MAKKLCVRKMQTESKRNLQQLNLVQHQNTKSERKNYRKTSESEREKPIFLQPETGSSSSCQIANLNLNQTDETDKRKTKEEQEPCNTERRG